MSRKSRTIEEKNRDKIRTVALMHELVDRTGSTNITQFSRWYDAQQSAICIATTEGSGKWRRNYKGECSLMSDQVDLLCTQFPDARQFYEDGPANLWRSMWGDISVLWDICSISKYAGPDLGLR